MSLRSCTRTLCRPGSGPSHDPAGRPPVGHPHPKEASCSCHTTVRQLPGLSPKLSPIPRSGSRSLSCTRIRFHPPARREEGDPARAMNIRRLDGQPAPLRGGLCAGVGGKERTSLRTQKASFLVKGIFQVSENSLNIPNASTAGPPHSGG